MMAENGLALKSSVERLGRLDPTFHMHMDNTTAQHFSMTVPGPLTVLFGLGQLGSARSCFFRKTMAD